MMFLHFAASAAPNQPNLTHMSGEDERPPFPAWKVGIRAPDRPLKRCFLVWLQRLCVSVTEPVENHRFLSSQRELVVGLAPPPLLAPPHQLNLPPLCALASAHHKDERFQSPSAFTPPSKTCWLHDSVYCTYSCTCRLI